MDNSSNEDELLQELNREQADLMVPVTVYVSVLMVLGVVGNLLVCYFYGWKTRITSNTIFIITLTVYDLLTCFISMPTELVDIQLFYTFTSATACKVMRFINYITALGSGLTLIAIAGDRYRLICKPMGKQLTLRNVRICCAAIGGLAILLSWPALVVYDSVEQNLVYSDTVNVTGYDCTVRSNDEFKWYNLALNGTHLVLFLVSVTVLASLYAIIGRTIYRMKKRKLKAASGDTDTVKFTVIMLAVTIVYVTSFLPYLCLKLWITFVGKQKAEFMTDPEMVGYKLGTQSFLINSVANPFIYGFFNPQFRNFLMHSVNCKQKELEKQPESISTRL